VELRYGLEDGRARSRAEIGRMLGISRERVRQLESRAVDRLYQRAGAAPPARKRAADPGAKASGPNGQTSSRQSFLRSWTLVLLWLRPAHVYELRARLRDLGLPPATYRMLQALEREGFLYSHWAPGRGAGPNRRVYSLTPRGVEQLGVDAEALRNMAETLSRFLGDADFLPSDEGDEPAS
jgi:DNA-binding PadR family transcriptional regulator